MIDPKERKKKEDAYIARVEFEKRQKKLQEQALEQGEKDRLKNLHWMRCPKCGMEMVEVDFEGVKVDRCSSCLGLFFDHGEVNHLVQKNRPGYLARLSSLFTD